MQSTVPKLGVGVFATVMLAVVAALAWDMAVANVIYEIMDLIDRYLGPLVAGIYEFLALVLWALVATVILVVVAMRLGKQGET